MSSSQGIFIKLRRALKRKVVGFGGDAKGSIAVEMAFILPIFASMAFLTFDAGTVYTQYKRGTRHYYALGDVISSQTQNLTCSQLDKISELVYASYANGNWARRPRPSGNDFTENGALDFRFQLKMIKAELQPNGKIKGRIEWAYWRHTQDMDTSGGKKPGELTNIPAGLQIDGLEFVQVDGALFIAPALNYLGVFDYNASSSKTHKQVPIDRYFPLRFITGLGLDYSADDPLTDKCWTKGISYP